MEWRVGSAECGVCSVKFKVWSVEWSVGSAKCKVWSVGVWSVKCGMCGVCGV